MWSLAAQVWTCHFASDLHRHPAIAVGGSTRRSGEPTRLSRRIENSDVLARDVEGERNLPTCHSALERPRWYAGDANRARQAATGLSKRKPPAAMRRQPDTCLND